MLNSMKSTVWLLVTALHVYLVASELTGKTAYKSHHHASVHEEVHDNLVIRLVP